MKTTKTAVDDIVRQLSPVIQPLIDGVLLPWKRPKNSTKVDVIVNSIFLANRPLQEGVLNVNIHAPNKKGISFNGIADDGQPNMELLSALEAVVLNTLDGNWQLDYHTDCEPGAPIRDADGTWYINVRVNYYAFQDNFKNI